MELDNEKRSVAIIKAWDLPIDVKTYTQKANAYIQFYNWMFFTRRWCTPQNSPYKNPKTASEKARKASFKARHAKNISKGKMSAAYWANKVKW